MFILKTNPPLQQAREQRLTASRGQSQPGRPQTATPSPYDIWPTLPTPLWEVIAPWGSICLPTSQHLLGINSREHRQRSSADPALRNNRQRQAVLSLHFSAPWHAAPVAVHAPHPCCFPVLLHFARDSD